MYDDVRDELIELIKERGCRHRERDVPLHSGGSTDVYLDVKGCLSDGRALNVATAALLHHMVANLDRWAEVTAIGGPTMGADALSAGMAARWGSALKWFSVRSSLKSHGLGRWVEGAALNSDDLVVLIDDVASTGDSLAKAGLRVQMTGARILAVMPLVDRSDKAAALFAECGISPYSPVLTYKDLGIEPL